MSTPRMNRLDRHALALALWLPAAFMALALFRFALGGGSWLAVAAGFAAVLLAFAGHVIVNAVTRTGFTEREVALGLVCYLASCVAFGLAALLSAEFRAQHFLRFGLGLIATFAGMVFYMIISFSLRGAFESLDVIRRFRD